MAEKNFSMFVPLKAGRGGGYIPRSIYERKEKGRRIRVTRIGSIFNFACIIINIKIDRGFVATVTHDEAFQFHSTDNTAINITRYRLKFGGWKTVIGTKKKKEREEKRKKEKNNNDIGKRNTSVYTYTYITHCNHGRMDAPLCKLRS